MKATILVVLLCGATAAFAQSYGSVLQNQPVIVEVPSHDQHADFRSMAAPQYLNETRSTTYGQGVQPLWEFPVLQESVSLGEAARQLRQEHLMAKKAVKVFSDQR
jgi:hypothetical protein